jgi:hypothetical protein
MSFFFHSPKGLLELLLLQPIAPSHLVGRELVLVAHGAVAARHQQLFQKTTQSTYWKRAVRSLIRKAARRSGEPTVSTQRILGTAKHWLYVGRQQLIC